MGKIKRYLLMNFLIPLLITGSTFLVISQIQNTKDITIHITNLSWSIIENEYINENNTKFRIDADYQINNKKGENVYLDYTCITNYFLLNFKYKSINQFQEIIVNGSNYGSQPSCNKLIIEQGITNGSTFMYWEIEQKKYETLPDGKYSFWIVLLDYGESYFKSKRLRQIIRDGLLIFDFP